METKKLIGIITDSAVDLTDELLNENEVEVLSYYVNMGSKTYVSRVDLSVNDLFKYADHEKVLPKTAQITPIEFMEYFEGFLEKYEQIIYIGLGSKFSGTFNNAIFAVNELEEEKNIKNKIFLIDTLNLSSGIGVLVLKACRLRRDGCSVLEICEEIKRCVPLVRTQFAINTLTYLHMGGRCSGTARLFGTLLNIKPIIRVVDGEMVVTKKPIGFKKALDQVVSYLKNDLDNLDLENVLITHCLANEDSIYLKSEVSKFLNIETKETFADVIVSTHCGPRCIGIIYILKN